MFLVGLLKTGHFTNKNKINIMDNKDLFDDSNLKMFGKDYIKVLTIMLKKAGKDASGALINSLDYRLVDEAGEIKIILEANDYLGYVDRGRKPGKYPNIKAISKWVSLRGIPQSAVFPIAHKIFKFGIKPTNVIDKTIREITTSPTFKKKYEDDLVEKVESVIYEQFKNNKK